MEEILNKIIVLLAIITGVVIANVILTVTMAATTVCRKDDSKDADYKNCSVVCIGCERREATKWFTFGKTYQVVNGILKDDQGFKWGPYKVDKEQLYAAGYIFIKLIGKW